MRYSATTSDGRTLLKTRNVTSRSYSIDTKSDSKAAQGAEHAVEFSLVKYFSNKPPDPSRLKNTSVEVTDTGGNQVKKFTLSDMIYSQNTGLFSEPVSIASDADTGIYSTDVEVFNIYHEKKTGSERFLVENMTATFNTTDLDVEINKTGVTVFNITLQSKISETNTIDAHPDRDLGGVTTVNDGNNISISGNQKKKV